MQKERNFFPVIMLYATTMFVLAAVRLLFYFGCFNALGEGAQDTVFTLLSQVVAMFGVSFSGLLIIARRRGEPQPFVTVQRAARWQKLSCKNFCLAVVLGLAMYLINIFVSGFFAAILQALGFQYPSSSNSVPGWGGLVLSIFLTAVLPAFCEEFLHRGVLLSGLNEKCNLRQAIIWSSVLFGLMHMNVGQFFYATFLGWLMCLAVLATGSLWVSVIMHFINNFCAVYGSYAAELNLPGEKFLSILSANPILFILAILLAFIVVGSIIKYWAQQNFERHRDQYTLRYLTAQGKMSLEQFDEVKQTLEATIQTLPTWKAVYAYLETFDQPQKMRPAEKAVWVAMIVFCGLITALSFVWGTW